VDALDWVHRWDAQQQGYVPDREERFTVIADAVAESAGPAPVVVDLGCGPGSLAVRLLDHLPRATVVGVDADPVLLALAQGAYGGWAGLRLVDADLRDPGWPQRLELDGPVDAVVSTTALHWLAAGELPALYAAVFGLLGPGGLLLNGDHLGLSAAYPALAELAGALGRRRLERARAGRAEFDRGPEDWQQWWDAVLAEPALADAVAERARRRAEHPRHQVEPGLDDHVRALRGAGFAEVDSLWQAGADRVLAARRAA
jgi:SAM-dependent methyltransferase